MRRRNEQLQLGKIKQKHQQSKKNLAHPRGIATTCNMNRVNQFLFMETISQRNFHSKQTIFSRAIGLGIFSLLLILQKNDHKSQNSSPLPCALSL
jgi:hypothetical protein